jgi:AcrR family transcriptional regulator
VPKAPPREPARPTRRTSKPEEDVAPRIARRERRRERSREEIIAAAKRVLVQNGIAATTLSAIAREVGVTKAALYYYFPSKEALLFELIFGAVEAQAKAVHAAVTEAKGGGGALRAIISATIHLFAPRLDDFRLAFLHGQVSGTDTVRLSAAELGRLHPLNDVAYAGAARLLAEDWKSAPGRARVDPRLMAFLASLSALGVLTLKGLVENMGDPLRYSDEQLIEGLSRIFEAAAAP